MFVMGNFVGMLANLLGWALQALQLVLVVNAVLSWFQPRPDHPILDVIENISHTVCGPVRRLFPTAMGGIDFAPLLVLLIIQFVGLGFLVPTLHEIAYRMR
ncbi:MAG: YggT family protein [Candidatus Eisenbacteria bacterium]|uniref:YggT family protein n=1 Tax=Eiseniibacteriota bacterium TaxID=2212470 RepID=A0A933W3B4_UNCEI|nr:YggT family protein [Candidatus Eisenbacteria bacterium]